MSVHAGESRANFRLDRGGILGNIASEIRGPIDVHDAGKIVFNALQGFLVYSIIDEEPMFRRKSVQP